MGGVWVFPGGAVDRDEGEGDAALRAAALRELDEEAGIALDDPGALVPFSRWITPAEVKTRFDTWFFLAPAPAGVEPQIDGEEAVDSGWFTPAGRARRAQERRDPARLPDDQDARAAGAVRHRRRAGRARARQGDPPDPAEGRHGRRDGAHPAARASRATTKSGRTRPCRPSPEELVRPGPAPGLTVAVTGPTGEIGKPFIRALERSRDVTKIIGMARRPFDPAVDGLAQDRVPPGRRARPRVGRRPRQGRRRRRAPGVHRRPGASTARATSTSRARATSSRRRSTAENVKRLVYTSSVAAYGFHDDNPVPIDEDVPARGSDEFPYSAQKAELERVLAEATRREHRRLRVPPVHRRRARRADDDRRDPVREARREAARRGAAAVRPGADPQAGHPRSRRPVPARPPRRRRLRAGRRRRSARASPASTTSPPTTR